MKRRKQKTLAQRVKELEERVRLLETRPIHIIVNPPPREDPPGYAPVTANPHPWPWQPPIYETMADEGVTWVSTFTNSGWSSH